MKKNKADAILQSSLVLDQDHTRWLQSRFHVMCCAMVQMPRLTVRQRSYITALMLIAAAHYYAIHRKANIFVPSRAVQSSSTSRRVKRDTQSTIQENRCSKGYHQNGNRVLSASLIGDRRVSRSISDNQPSTIMASIRYKKSLVSVRCSLFAVTAD